MLYKLHYFLTTSGLNAVTVLLGVYINTYTDASSLELGFLLMLMPFTGIFSRPIVCSYADRKQAHQKCIMWCLFICGVSYSPYLIIPFLGPEVYKVYTRTCWYILVISKVIGDAAIGGVWSVGDSLAINYAAKVGVDFSIYRIWGTISWMTFGFLVGQINEVSFLPKYVPAFAILVVADLLDVLVIWLWPPEYFTMVQREKIRKKSTTKSIEKKKVSSFTKSLMPKEVVWAHAKNKLFWLITLGLYDSNKNGNYINDKAPKPNNNLKISTLAVIGGQQSEKVADKVNVEEGKFEVAQTCNKGDGSVDKSTQLKILVYLMKKDPRILLYILFFICAGASLSPVSFLMIHLSNRCSDEGSCQISQLAGLLQVSMALSETVLFICIRKLKAIFGRLNLIAIGIGILSIKYLYYETLYLQLDPYYTFIIETLQGVAYGIFLQISVELAHIFALEVRYVIPELYETGIVGDEVDRKKLELSLCATMQALIACSQDGLGRGLGSLTFGLLVEIYGYDNMWLGITICSGIVSIITFMINFASHIFNIKYGFGETEEEEEEGEGEVS